MSMTIRYPDGTGVTFNDANYLYHGHNENWYLKTASNEKGGKTVAIIQAGAGVSVEFRRPCLVENPARNVTIDSAIDLLIENCRTVSTYRLARLKSALRDFNAKSCRWK